MNINEMLTQLNPQEFLSLNAKLQKKKNALRKELAERGVLKREGNNTFDRYKYFSEAQYKLLFTELLSTHGLELKFEELEYGLFEGSEKQSNGRMPKIEYTLMDADTGFGETTIITGEAVDKGDKAGYKAYTGSLKYYLANTFLVATGDDPETESPDVPMNKKKQTAQKYTPAPQNPVPQTTAPQTNEERKATPQQLEILAKTYTGENLQKLLDANGITQLGDMPMRKASELIEKIQKRAKNNG